jgi:hypothetical protein
MSEKQIFVKQIKLCRIVKLEQYGLSEGESSTIAPTGF